MQGQISIGAERRSCLGYGGVAHLSPAAEARTKADEGNAIKAPIAAHSPKESEQIVMLEVNRRNNQVRIAPDRLFEPFPGATHKNQLMMVLQALPQHPSRGRFFLQYENTCHLLRLTPARILVHPARAPVPSAIRPRARPPVQFRWAANSAFSPCIARDSFAKLSLLPKSVHASAPVTGYLALMSGPCLLVQPCYDAFAGTATVATEGTAWRIRRIDCRVTGLPLPRCTGELFPRRPHGPTPWSPAAEALSP